MTLLDREVVPPSVSTKGIVYSAFLLLLVVSLFFIPEIVRFQESIGKSKRTVPSVAQTSSVNIEDLIPSKNSISNLDKILNAVTGTGRKESKARDGLTIQAPEVQPESNTTPTDASTGSLKDIQDKVMLEKTFGGAQAVTWEQLNSGPVKKAFRSAQTNATKILKGLSGRQSAVRFALINYVNGLGWITRGERKLMSAEEAMAYIEQLDINVTQAMLTSETDAADFEAWKRVSFGPLTLNSRAAAFKVGNSIAFNPRMTLSAVEIQKTPDYVIKKNGAVVAKRSHSSIRLSGFVLGKDIKKIVVYRNGRRVADLRVSKRGTDEGIRTFKWRYRAADGLFTMRAYSAEGEMYEKNYVFLTKVYRRFRQDSDGYYMLPFGDEDSDVVSVRNLDSRLDRFFRVYPRGSGSSDGFADGGSEGTGGRGFDTF